MRWSWWQDRGATTKIYEPRNIERERIIFRVAFIAVPNTHDEDKECHDVDSGKRTTNQGNTIRIIPLSELGIWQTSILVKLFRYGTLGKFGLQNWSGQRIVGLRYCMHTNISSECLHSSSGADPYHLQVPIDVVVVLSRSLGAKESGQSKWMASFGRRWSAQLGKNLNWIHFGSYHIWYSLLSVHNRSPGKMVSAPATNGHKQNDAVQGWVGRTRNSRQPTAHPLVGAAWNRVSPKWGVKYWQKINNNWNMGNRMELWFILL